jgi:hypothetical protein
MSREPQTLIDKTGWPPGPWHDEPDRVAWVDKTTGYHCLILRSEVSGALCGYVALSPQHPLWGLDYEDIDVQVHGGLTWANPPDEFREQGSPDLWWVGFDCSHAFDRMPGIEAAVREARQRTLDQFAARADELSDAEQHDFQQLIELGDRIHEPLLDRLGMMTSYKDLAWVTAEVESLAQQLKAMEG